MRKTLAIFCPRISTLAVVGSVTIVEQSSEIGYKFDKFVKEKNGIKSCVFLAGKSVDKVDFFFLKKCFLYNGGTLFWTSCWKLPSSNFTTLLQIVGFQSQVAKLGGVCKWFGVFPCTSGQFGNSKCGGCIRCKLHMVIFFSQGGFERFKKQCFFLVWMGQNNKSSLERKNYAITASFTFAHGCFSKHMDPKKIFLIVFVACGQVNPPKNSLLYRLSRKNIGPYAIDPGGSGSGGGVTKCDRYGVQANLSTSIWSLVLFWIPLFILQDFLDF